MSPIELSWTAKKIKDFANFRLIPWKRIDMESKMVTLGYTRFKATGRSVFDF